MPWRAILAALAAGVALGLGIAALATRADPPPATVRAAVDAERPAILPVGGDATAGDGRGSRAGTGAGSGRLAPEVAGATTGPFETSCAGAAAGPPSPSCVAALAAVRMEDPGTRERVLALLAAAPLAHRAALLTALQPVPLAGEDLRPLMSALREVHDRGDAEQRATALVGMAQWDRSQAIAPLLRQGLYDEDPRVVQAAITAVALSNVRGQDVKEALLVLADDAAPDAESRAAAVAALRDFSLDRGEYAIFRRSADTMPDDLRQ